MTEYNAPRLERVFALLAAVVVVLTTAGPGLLPVAVATAGLLLFALGLVGPSRNWLSGGALGLFFGVLLHALVTGDPVPTLVGGAATMLAWDLSEQAVNLGEHLGRRGVTRRARGVHAAGSLAVATLGTGAGYATLVAAPGPIPLVALVAFCLAVVVLVVVISD